MRNSENGKSHFLNSWLEYADCSSLCTSEWSGFMWYKSFSFIFLLNDVRNVQDCGEVEKWFHQLNRLDGRWSLGTGFGGCVLYITSLLFFSVAMAVPVVNRKLLEELEAMGFYPEQATRALHFSGDSAHTVHANVKSCELLVECFVECTY